MNARQAAARMSERDLQDRVRRMCDQLGLAVEHTENSLQGRTWLPGWPDLTICGTRILYRELKSMHGQLSHDQRRVGRIIANAGGDWDVWRPIDLFSGQIALELTAISRLDIAVFTADDIGKLTI